MARIPYPDVADPRVAPLVDKVRRERNGKLPMLFLMHMHSPAIFEAWLSMGTALRYQTSLDDRSRELSICAVARLLGYGYQYETHAPIAAEAGVDQTALDQLPRWRDVPSYTDRDRIVLAYTEALTGTADVGPDIFERLQTEFDSQQIMELTALAAFYGCGARFLKALQVRSDDTDRAA